ncbi:MAG: 3-hydroxyacyl-CoA dehydrogenase NAD-binding domain-containing protein [Solirubrobacterales bacterium]
MEGSPRSAPIDLPDAPIGIVGAGTMGGGIAHVAATGGFEVKLFDPAEGAAQKAVMRIGDFLQRAVQRGRMQPEPAQAALTRIEPCGSLDDLGDCFIVIEAVPEDLQLKRELFERLTIICGSDTVLATNTSSIPVTSIASGIDRPARVVGMHFFNPVPLMKLVEVIAGVNSGEIALATTREVARRMGREPIDANDGPGFLVNRCSRPFLLEAQRLLQERVADHETIDRIVRLGGGFRMGPFELSDLVGVDVGYDIARSFYALGHNEPRWQPSNIAKQMVAAGRLGRKTRHGYYTYPENGEYRSPDPPPQMAETASGMARIIGDSELAGQIRRLAAAAGYELAGGDTPTPNGGFAITVDARIYGAGDQLDPAAGPTAVLCAGRSLATAARGRDFAGFHCLPPLGESHMVELTRGIGTSEITAAATAHFFHAIGRHVTWVADAPGLVLGRIVCQLINEAAFAVQEGVGSPADIDKGVQRGLNFPRGLLSWADMIGINQVVATIDALQHEIGGDRYRAAPWLRRMAAEGSNGRASGHGFYRY